MQTTTKRYLTAISCAATIMLASACNEAAPEEGGPTNGAPTEEAGGGNEGGAPEGEETTPAEEGGDGSEGGSDNGGDDGSQGGNDESGPAENECGPRNGGTWAHVIEKGDIDCETAERVTGEYIGQQTDEDAEVEGYTCSTVKLAGDEGGKGADSMNYRYHFCSNDEAAFRTIVPEAIGLEGTYAHTPDYELDGMYAVKVGEDVCTLAPNEVTCFDNPTNEKIDDAVWIEWDGEVESSRDGGTPPYTLPGEPQSAKELPQGEIVTAYGFSCGNPDGMKLECVHGQQKFNTADQFAD